MQNEINKLIQTIKHDYVKFTSRNGTKELSTVNKDMIQRFDSELGFKAGNKYIKVTTNNGGSVWGFVVATDSDKKFRKGDILKAASFGSPARNAARGNVFENYNINWTGPNYL